MCSRLVVLMVALGLVAPTLPVVGGHCVGDLAPAAEPCGDGAFPADTCCWGEEVPQDPTTDEDDDCCPGGCVCVCCGCAATPAVHRFARAPAPFALRPSPLADRSSGFLPQDSVGELLRPPQP